MTRVIYYETGCQQRLPLFSYEGMSRQEAEKVVREKTTFRRFELCTAEELKKKKEQIKSVRNVQWYIIRDRELITNTYYTIADDNKKEAEK